MNAAPTISAIVTCKGRLAHPQETLPLLMAAGFDEVVVVDFDCPDRAGDWVAASFPAAKVVRAAPRPSFNVSAARNLGAAAATGDWLFFCDADTRVGAGFVADARARLAFGHHFRPEPRSNDLYGVIAVSRADFEAMGGYDDVIEGWGGEDRDLVDRLEVGGIRAAALDGRLLSAIAHDDVLRTRFQRVADYQFSALINNTYSVIKRDVAAAGIACDRPAREALYAEVSRALLASPPARQLHIALRREPLFGQISADVALTYELTWPKRDQVGG